MPKMIFLDRLNSPKFDFMQNWSDGKIVKLQQSQALTSHFESFWSIVRRQVRLALERPSFLCANLESCSHDLSLPVIFYIIRRHRGIGDSVIHHGIYTNGH